MKTYSIAGSLPVNVIVKANSKKDAIEFARNNPYLEYESAGDIEINDAKIVKI